jgi:hypothetical protein
MRFANRRTSLVGCTLAVISCLGAGSARAGQVIATPLLEQDPVNSFVTCLITASGTRPVPVASVKFIDEKGNAAGSFGGCTFPGTIFPGESCVQVPDALSNGYVRCEVEPLGSGKTLRVELISRNPMTGQVEFNEGR